MRQDDLSRTHLLRHLKRLAGSRVTLVVRVLLEASLHCGLVNEHVAVGAGEHEALAGHRVARVHQFERLAGGPEPDAESDAERVRAVLHGHNLEAVQVAGAHQVVERAAGLLLLMGGGRRRRRVAAPRILASGRRGRRGRPRGRPLRSCGGQSGSRRGGKREWARVVQHDRRRGGRERLDSGRVLALPVEEPAGHQQPQSAAARSIRAARRRRTREPLEQRLLDGALALSQHCEDAEVVVRVHVADVNRAQLQKLAVDAFGAVQQTHLVERRFAAIQ